MNDLIPAAGYVRCSTGDKQEKSLPRQKQSLIEFARKLGYVIIKWYEDDGKSGATAEGRPGFMALMDRMKERHHGMQAVFVYDLSRWGRFRTPRESMYWLFVCDKAGAPVKFKVNAEMLNQNNTIADVGIAMESGSATDENRRKSALIFERSCMNVEDGFFSGGTPPFGYQRLLLDPDGIVENNKVLAPGKRKEQKGQKVVLIPGLVEDVAIVRRIFRMRGDEKLGFKAIAERLNEEGVPPPNSPRRNRMGRRPKSDSWGHTYIADITRNLIYVGVMTYGKTKKGKYRTLRVETIPESDWSKAPYNEKLVIIDEGLWARVRALEHERRSSFERKDQGRSLTSQRYLLAGLIKCGSCGHNFQGRRRRNATGREYFYYTDGGYVKGGRSVCDPFHIPSRHLEDEVLALIQSSVLRGIDADRMVKKVAAMLRAEGESTSSRLRELNRELGEQEKRLDRLVSLVAEGADFDAFHSRIQSIQQSVRILKDEMLRYTSGSKPGDPDATAQALVLRLRDIRSVLANGSPLQRKDIVRRFVQKIEIDKTQHRAAVHLRRLPTVRTGKSLDDLMVVGSSVHAGGRDLTKQPTDSDEIKHVIDLARIIALKQAVGKRARRR